MPSDERNSVKHNGVIAVIFGERITTADLESRMPVKNLGGVDEAANEQYRIAQFAKQLDTIFIARVLARNDLTPTHAECFAASQFMVEGYKSAWRKQLLELDTRLHKEVLTEKQQSAIRANMEQLESQIAAAEELRAPSDDVPETNLDNKINRYGFAALIVAEWKFNKLLYREFGGRVVAPTGDMPTWMPVVPPAIDAKKQWIDEMVADGNIQFLDDHVRDSYYRSLDADRLIKPESDPYATPPWARYLPEDAATARQPEPQNGEAQNPTAGVDDADALVQALHRVRTWLGEGGWSELLKETPKQSVERLFGDDTKATVALELGYVDGHSSMMEATEDERDTRRMLAVTIVQCVDEETAAALSESAGKNLTGYISKSMPFARMNEPITAEANGATYTLLKGEISAMGQTGPIAMAVASSGKRFVFWFHLNNAIDDARIGEFVRVATEQ